MNRFPLLLLATSLALGLSSCATNVSTPAAVGATQPPPSGERLAYLVGCVNCHHQTPKEILNAPPLVVVKTYSIAEFRTLLKTGVTRGGRDMYGQGSIMGIVAREQLSYFTDEEMLAVYEFLKNDWTAQRGVEEEAKIATFPPPTFMKN
jgi:cytochrome c553